MLSPAQVADFRARTARFFRANGVRWKPKPAVTLRMSVDATAVNRVDLGIFATHRSCWQEAKVYGDASTLLEWMISTLTEMGVAVEAPRRDVRVLGDAHAPARLRAASEADDGGKAVAQEHAADLTAHLIRSPPPRPPALQPAHMGDGGATTLHAPSHAPGGRAGTHGRTATLRRRTQAGPADASKGGDDGS